MTARLKCQLRNLSHTVTSEKIMFCQCRVLAWGGDKCQCFSPLRYFEALTVSLSHSAAVKSSHVWRYSFIVGKARPFMSEPSGPCYSRCEGVRAQEGCRAVGSPWLTGQGKTARSQSSMTLYSHCYRFTHSCHHGPFVEKIWLIKKMFTGEFVATHAEERSPLLACI